MSLGCHFCDYLVTSDLVPLPCGLDMAIFFRFSAAQSGYISNSGAGARFMQMIQGVCRSSLGQVHYLNNSGSASRSTMLTKSVV